MGTVSLIAKSAFPYNGRSLKSGDLFDAVSERDADTLKLIGKADDAPRLRKPAYTRKDVTAESHEPESVDPVEPVERTKRQYRRRDLVPEP